MLQAMDVQDADGLPHGGTVDLDMELGREEDTRRSEEGGRGLEAGPPAEGHLEARGQEPSVRGGAHVLVPAAEAQGRGSWRPLKAAGHHLVQVGDDRIGEELGIGCQICGAYGAANGLRRLQRRGGLLFTDCKGSRAQGTKEQRRRMAQGKHPLPSRGSARACVFDGLGPKSLAAWGDLEREEEGQGCPAPPPPMKRYGTEVKFSNLDDIFKAYGVTADEAMRYGRELAAIEQLAGEELGDELEH